MILFVLFYIMLKNGQAYFKNTAVETSQDFKSIFGHFSTLYMKVLNYYYFFFGGRGNSNCYLRGKIDVHSDKI